MHTFWKRDSSISITVTNVNVKWRNISWFINRDMTMQDDNIKKEYNSLET